MTILSQNQKTILEADPNLVENKHSNFFRDKIQTIRQLITYMFEFYFERYSFLQNSIKFSNRFFFELPKMFTSFIDEINQEGKKYFNHDTITNFNKCNSNQVKNLINLNFLSVK